MNNGGGVTIPLFTFTFDFFYNFSLISPTFTFDSPVTSSPWSS
jgi:hypothetical protein